MNYIKKIIYGSKLHNLIDLGIEQLEEENYLSAIDVFSHALDINDSSPDALFQRGKCYFQINNFEKAKIDFLQLEKTNHIYDSEIFYLLAKIYLNQNNTAVAKEFAEKYLELNNEDIQAQYFAARVKYLNEDYDESLDLVDLISLKTENNFDLLYLRSLILFAQENFVSAIIDLDKAININPLNEFAFNLRALLHIQLINYKDAINDFGYAIKLCPTNSLYYFNLAKVQLKIGDLFEANNSLSKAIEIDSKNKTYFLLKGEIELLNENNIEAIDSFVKAHQIESDDLEVFHKISKLKMNSGDFENAKLDLDKIREIEGEKFDDYYYGAFLDYQLDNYEGSITNLKAVIERNPENTDAVLQLGILKLSMQNYSEAYDTFKLIKENDKNYKTAGKYKIQALNKLGKLNDAAVEFESLLINDQDDNLILGSQISYLNGNYELSEEYLNKYTEKNPDNTNSKLLLNLIRAKQTKLDQTKEINEFEFDGHFKRVAQIFNGIINFEKEQYYSAKYRLSSIEDLSYDEQKYLKPLLLYAEEQIS